MNFVYLTAKAYPATTADHFYIRSLAYGFSHALGTNFLLVVRGKDSHDLAGLPVKTVRAPESFRTIFYFFWLPLFMRFLRGDLVFFCNDFNLLSILAFWKPFFGKRVRICSDWHLMTDTWKDRLVAKSSDVLITTSERLRQGIIDKTGVPGKRVRVVYGGIDLAPYEKPLTLSRADLGLPEGYLVGYVGLFKTMGKEKGLRTMIEALVKLPPDVILVFVGGSPEEIQEYSAFAEQKAVASRCVWVKKQSFDMVVVYERSMDALVIPYPDEPHFRDYGFPMKAYEYIATGKPIVYSGMPILDEVLKGYGISFSPEDASSMAEAIRRTKAGYAHKTDSVNVSWDDKAKNILMLIEHSLV